MFWDDIVAFFIFLFSFHKAQLCWSEATGKNEKEEKEKKNTQIQNQRGDLWVVQFFIQSAFNITPKSCHLFWISQKTSQYLLTFCACQYGAAAVVGASGLPLSPP